MTIRMSDKNLVTLGQLEGFTRGSHLVVFSGATRKEKYQWIDELLVRFFYFTLRKKDKMTVRKFIMKVTSYSDAQVTRLIRKKKQTRYVLVTSSPTRSTFPTTYTTSDVARLIEMDEAHGRLSGPATKKLFQRAYDLFHDERFVRLKDLSVSHLYNLRLVHASPTTTRLSKGKTEASSASIWGTRISHDITRWPSTNFTKHTSTGR